MRRDLLEELPALSREFHIRPQDIDTMTVREVAEYRSALRQLAEQAEQAGEG